MRTIDATLTAALAAGTGKPFIKVYIGEISLGTVHASGQAISYKLTGQALDVDWMNSNIGLVSSSTGVWLERGLTIAGTDYTLTTSRFFIQTQRFTPDGHHLIHATLFPKAHYTAAGDGTYNTVLTALCSNYGKTLVKKAPADAYWQYQFFPTGKSLTLNDPNQVAHLIQQKYELFYCDNGNEEILFYCCQGSLMVAPDFTITPTNGYAKDLTKLRNRYFVWRDELGTSHSLGTATDPLHNLGFLPSTASAPSRTTNAATFQAITRPDFRVQDGDIFEINAMGVTQRGFALVTEQYIAPDHNHKQPRWEMIVDANPVFDNTAGGALPSTIERVSNYTPLNTSMFAGILGSSDNNLQAAMDKLDDHTHIGGVGYMPYVLPIATPANAASGATLRLPANGGSIAIPFYVPAPMALASVTIRNTDTATARTWGWDLYYEATSSNVLTRVAQSFTDQTFTPTVAAWRTIVASGGPITLAPGLYWLVVQCRHATNDFGFGTIAGQSTNLTQVKTTSNPNGATLDFTLATWTKDTSLACARLNGAVFAQATAF